MNEVKDFRAAARARDVPDDVIDWWLQLTRPRLELDRDGDGPVAGYFGGRPALPAGVAWPDGMVYLASVDLAAIPAGTLDIDLPKDGALLFFSETGLTPDDSRVIYVPAGTAVTEAEPPEAHLTVYDRFALRSSVHYSIPQARSESLIDLGESRYDEEVLSSIVWHVDAGGGNLAIGGYGTATTGGVGNPIGPAETDVMLAQLYLTDDIVGEDFECDLVILFCMITRDDLAAGRFDRVEIQSDFHG